MDHSDLYTPDYYALHTAKLRKNTSFHRHRMKILRGLVQPVSGERILDLGCGMGTVSIEFARYGANMIGLDSSPTAIRIAQAICNDISQGNAQFLLGEASRIPSTDDSFDKIICADFVEHIERCDYVRMLSECYRVLKPLGRLFIYTPCPTHVFELLKRNDLVLRRDPSHVDLKDMSYLERSVADASFTVERAYFENSFIPIFSRVEKALMHLPKIGRVFQRRICIAAVKK